MILKEKKLEESVDYLTWKVADLLQLVVVILIFEFACFVNTGCKRSS